jgi:hypothetical protein
MNRFGWPIFLIEDGKMDHLQKIMRATAPKRGAENGKGPKGGEKFFWRWPLR